MAPAAATAHSAPAPGVAPYAVPLPWWADPRFQLPAALLGASVLAVGAFAVLHFTVGRRAQKDDRGWRFPEKGYLLCAEAMGTHATDKPLRPNTFVVVWLGDSEGRFVEATWGQIVAVDPADPDRVEVRLIGEHVVGGIKPLQTDRHGFRVTQQFPVTRDCVADALVPLGDPASIVVCGADLLTYDGADSDAAPDGHGPAVPSTMPAVGQQVKLLLAARGGEQLDKPIDAWSLPIRAQVVRVSETGQIPTVKVLEVPLHPKVTHGVKAGDEFDITWDCVVKYL